MDTATILYRFGLVLLLLIMNGFFVAVEFAVVAARRSRIDQLVEEGNGAARIVRRWMDNPDRLIAAAQLGITVASLALGYIGESAVAALIEPLLHHYLGEDAIGGVARSLPFLLSLVVVTSFHVVLGEQAPKSAAIRYPERILLPSARPMQLFTVVFRPFVEVLDRVSAWVLGLVGIEQTPGGHHAVLTIDELKYIVSESQQGGVLDAGEREMLHNIFDFGETVARQVMTPRTEIVAVSSETPLDDLLGLVVETGYTKFPVYDGDMDHVVGIIHVKDLIAALQRPEHERQSLARDLMRDALNVPETIGVEELLQTFRVHRTHLAILLDEFGGTSGLVTLEDLLEEIVGDVQDQFEEQEPQISALPGGEYLVSGLVPIEDFNAEFRTRLDDPNYDTIAGYLLGQLGRLAQVGDEVTLPEGTLRVETLDGRRIDRILFAPAPASANGDGETVSVEADHDDV